MSADQLTQNERAANEIIIRPLRRGEDRAWRACRCGDWPPDGPDFTHDPAFRPEAHLVADRDGQIVGRMESTLNEPHSAILVDPIGRDGEDVEEIVSKLLTESLSIARSKRVAEIDLILESNLPYLEQACAIAEQFGFRPSFEKSLYSRDTAPLPELSPGQSLTFRSVAKAGDDAAIETIAQILRAPVNRYEVGISPRSMFEELVALCHRTGTLDRGDWFLASEKGQVIGIVMPALTDLSTRRATILFVGVAPEFRSRGFGRLLTLKGLRTLAVKSPTAFIDSTDTHNTAMRRILEEFGYQQTAVQHYFRWQSPH